MAYSCIKNRWEDYEPTEINLDEFMKIGASELINDELLVGINFD